MSEDKYLDRLLGGGGTVSNSPYRTNPPSITRKLAEAGRYYLNAYDLAVQRGYKGTMDEWLESLVGRQGDPGAVGKSLSFAWGTGDNAGRLGVRVGDTGEYSYSDDLHGPQGDPTPITMRVWTEDDV